MKKLYIFLALIVFASQFFLGVTAIAQESEFDEEAVSEEEVSDTEDAVPGESGEEEGEELPELQAVLQMADIVQLGKNIIFDASDSVNPFPETSLIYEWNFGDETTGTGEEVVHMYTQHGEYTVTLTVRDAEGNEHLAEKSVFVYENLLLLITNDVAQKTRMYNLQEYGRESGTYVKMVESFDSVSDFIAEDVLIQKLSESIEDIRKADRLVFWTRSSLGLTLLSRLKESFDMNFQNKDIIFVSDGPLSLLSNIARGTFRTVQPKRIILTRTEAMWPFVDSSTVDEFLLLLDQRGLQYEVIDKSIGINLTNFMSYGMNFMIDRGIPSNSLKLILMLPVIVTVVAFMKQVIGMTTLGVYTPSILALSFVALDIWYGLLILLIILIIGTLIRLFLRNYRLLYIPRMAIVLTFVSITILGIMLLGALFNISHIVSISIFPMLIMSTLTEKFVSIQTGKGFRSALFLISETLFVSILCYYVAVWEFMQTLMLSHPELIFVFLFINIILGRWTGLRIFEYIRFREVLRHAEEE